MRFNTITRNNDKNIYIIYEIKFKIFTKKINNER